MIARWKKAKHTQILLLIQSKNIVSKFNNNRKILNILLQLNNLSINLMKIMTQITQINPTHQIPLILCKSKEIDNNNYF